jgi:hypothetical protein
MSQLANLTTMDGPIISINPNHVVLARTMADTHEVCIGLSFVAPNSDYACNDVPSCVHVRGPLADVVDKLNRAL